MAKKEKSKVKVVKVRPYPFPCRLYKSEGQPPLLGQVLRLEELGFVFEEIGHFYRLGEIYICDFDIPVFKKTIHAPVKIIKTLESSQAYTPSGSRNIVMTVEVHFQDLNPEERFVIKSFAQRVKPTEI